MRVVDAGVVVKMLAGSLDPDLLGQEERLYIPIDDRSTRASTPDRTAGLIVCTPSAAIPTQLVHPRVCGTSTDAPSHPVNRLKDGRHVCLDPISFRTLRHTTCTWEARRGALLSLESAVISGTPSRTARAT